MWKHKTIIISEEYLSIARMLCEKLAGAGGSGMFQTALSADGAAPATHYVSSGPIEEQFADLLDSGAENIYSTITAAGIEIPFETIQAVLTFSDISSDIAEVAFARNGLEILQVVEPI